MDAKYYIVFFGEPDWACDKIWQILLERVRGLGIDPDQWLKRLNAVDYAQFQHQGEVPRPLVVIYRGNAARRQESYVVDAMDRMLPVFPVADSGKSDQWKSELPEGCHKFQCTFLDSPNGLERLVNSLLECLSLLRDKRRVFLSYKRNETDGVVQQVFNALNGRGYHTFLDTSEIVPGEFFQNVLMHQLVDSDLLILLDSPSIHHSDWVKKELDQAEDHGIGILRLAWPQVPTLRTFLESLTLDNPDLVGMAGPHQQLAQAALTHLLTLVERMRVKAVGRRLKRLHEYCGDLARSRGWQVTDQPEGLRLEKGSYPIAWLRLVTGVPVSQDYQSVFRLAQTKNISPHLASIFYHEGGLNPKWLEHIYWLDKELPVTSTNRDTLDAWLGGA